MIDKIYPYANDPYKPKYQFHAHNCEQIGHNTLNIEA